jgi:hypothetical protein
MPADAQDLVSTARDLVRIDDDRTAGLWPRAAALLGRQALELSLARLWTLTAPGLERTSARCQLLCLTGLLDDRDLAGRVSSTWSGLSRACHHRAYELAPTAAELTAWLETVWALDDRVERLHATVGRRQAAPR